jgi:hypothetical protein
MKEQLDKIIEMPYEQRQLANDLLRIIIRDHKPVSMGELSRAKVYRFYVVRDRGEEGLLTIGTMDAYSRSINLELISPSNGRTTKEQLEKVVEMLNSLDRSEKLLGFQFIENLKATLNSTVFVPAVRYRLYYIMSYTFPKQYSGKDYDQTILAVSCTEAYWSGWRKSQITGDLEPFFNTTVAGVIAAEKV